MYFIVMKHTWRSDPRGLCPSTVSNHGIIHLPLEKMKEATDGLIFIEAAQKEIRRGLRADNWIYLYLIEGSVDFADNVMCLFTNRMGCKTILEATDSRPSASITRTTEPRDKLSIFSSNYLGPASEVTYTDLMPSKNLR